jgi:Fur family peroxide stress response transcriptional regulator
MKPLRRKSRQRDMIFNLIESSQDHPTAHMIFEMLKKEIRSASMGNVYRNIRILREEGLIVSRDFGDGVERFDAITHAHYHFICEKCKSVSDFAMPVQESITSEAQKMTKHTVRGHTIQFHGICDTCRKHGGKG